MSVPHRPSKGVAWLYSEVCALLDLWADQEVQLQLAGRLHNMCVYDKISQKLRVLGIDRTGEQCREKIKKLRRDYKTVLDNNYSAAFARKLLGCYDKVHEIFGKCTVRKPTTVVESIAYNDGASEPKDEKNAHHLENPEIAKAHSRAPDPSYKRFQRAERTNPLVGKKSYQKLASLQKMLQKRRNKLQKILTTLEKKRFEGEFKREKQRLTFLENQNRNQKDNESKLFRSLLSLLAEKRGFSFHCSD